MLKRIIVFSLTGLLILSLILYVGGVRELSFDNTFYVWLKGVNSRFESWKLTIPNVPELVAESSGVGGEILEVIKGFVNFFVRIMNVFILVINVAIQLIQFVLTIVYSVLDLKDMLLTSLNILHV